MTTFPSSQHHAASEPDVFSDHQPTAAPPFKTETIEHHLVEAAKLPRGPPPALLARDAMQSDSPDPAAANVAMHTLTGAFVDTSLESTFEARLYRMAFPVHVFVLAFGLAAYTWSALAADLLDTLGDVNVLCAAVALVGRVLIHRMHDLVRAQRMGSRIWTILLTLSCIADMAGVVTAPATACASVLQEKYMMALVGEATVLINGSHGMVFAHKAALIALVLADCLVAISGCGEAGRSLGPVLVCTMGVVVLGAATLHVAELYLRHGYAETMQEKVQEKQHLVEERSERKQLEERLDAETRRLEERNEQLKAEKERLMYDVQCRGRPLDNDDDRSAIRHGLRRGVGSSEAGDPTPSDAPLPSLPPGPPSSAETSGRTETSGRSEGGGASDEVGPLGPARSSTDSGPSVNFMTLAALEHKAPAETDTSSTTSGTASLGALLSPSSRRSRSAGQPVPLSWAEADRQFYADRAAARAAARPGKRAVPLTWAEAERRRLAVDRQFYAGRAAAAGKGTAPLASMEADLEQPACSSTETVRGPVAPRSRPNSQKAAVSTAKQAEVPISWAMADRQFYASAATTNTVRLTAPSSSAAPTPSGARASVAPFEQAVVAVQMAALSRHAESAGFDAESASFAASLTMTTPRTLQPEVNSGVRLIDMVSLTYLEDSEAEAAMLRNALTGSMA